MWDAEVHGHGLAMPLGTREAPGAVLVSAEVVVLVPSGEGQGEATGREGGGKARRQWSSVSVCGQT